MSNLGVVKGCVMNSEEFKDLPENSAQVISFAADVITGYGEMVENIDNGDARQKIHNLCAGGQQLFGSSVFVVFRRNNGTEVIRGSECKKVLAFSQYESKIRL